MDERSFAGAATLLGPRLGDPSRRHVLVINVARTSNAPKHQTNTTIEKLASLIITTNITSRKNVGDAELEKKSACEAVASDAQPTEPPGPFEAGLRALSALRAPLMPTFDVAEPVPLGPSSDIGPDEWAAIARTIERRYHRYDGFLICHGTDTMHYTAAALSFMLRNLGKPVILTPAARPAREPTPTAPTTTTHDGSNVSNAGGFAARAPPPPPFAVDSVGDETRSVVVGLLFAGNARFCEVAILTGDVALRGCRAQKVSLRGDQFASPNYPPLAAFSRDGFVVFFDRLRPQPKGRFSVSTAMRADVLSVLLVADADYAAVERAAAAGRCCAVVVGVPRTGSLPRPSAAALASLAKAAAAAGVLVAAVPNHDGTGGFSARHRRMLATLGVATAGDATPECAAVKLMHLFGLGLPLKEVRDAFQRCLVGELTPDATAHDGLAEKEFDGGIRLVGKSRL